MKGNPQDKSGFSPDRMMDSTFPADFDTFFATNLELIKRGIGLNQKRSRTSSSVSLPSHDTLGSVTNRGPAQTVRVEIYA